MLRNHIHQARLRSELPENRRNRNEPLFLPFWEIARKSDDAPQRQQRRSLADIHRQRKVPYRKKWRDLCGLLGRALELLDSEHVEDKQDIDAIPLQVLCLLKRLLLQRRRRDKTETDERSIDDTSSGKKGCLLYTSPSPRDGLLSRMPSSA